MRSLVRREEVSDNQATEARGEGAMRFEAGWLVHVPGRDFPSTFGDVINLVRTGAYLVLKPAIIPVRIKGTTMFVGIPSGTVVAPPTYESVSKNFVKSYVLADDTWLDAKPVGVPNVIDEVCPLAELIEEGIPENKVGACEMRCYRSIKELNDRLNRRQVALIQSGNEFSVKGTLLYLWRTHPVLSCLDHRPVSCRCWDPGELGRLGYVSKPLAYVDDVVVAAEVTHNRSFIFFCDCLEDVKTLYLRAMMYSC